MSVGSPRRGHSFAVLDFLSCALALSSVRLSTPQESHLGRCLRPSDAP